VASERAYLPASLPEQLTEQFYAWERRGRGWLLWDYPVVLEPPFVPFSRWAPLPNPVRDDARRPGFFERIWGRLRRRGEAVDLPSTIGVTDSETFEESDPTADEIEAPDLVEIQVLTPAFLEVREDLAVRLLLGLGASNSLVSFELIGLPGRLVLELVVRQEDAGLLRSALGTFVPELLTLDTPGLLRDAWTASPDSESVIVDFGLSQEFMLPLAIPRSFAVDPLLGFIAGLEDLRDGEVGLLQVLFQRTAYPWAESALRAIRDGEGGAFFADAPETLTLTKTKISDPLFAAGIRVAARASTESRAWQIARNLGGAIAQFADPTSNELVPLSNEGYASEDHEADVLTRRTRRSGMLVSARELAALVHVPTPSVRAASLRAPARKTKAAPTSASVGDVLLGENIHRGKTISVKVTRDLRLRHTYVIGGTGTGKSTLLLNLIRQDIEAGRGVGLLDPHGDLAEEVLASIPDARLKDVVVFDPSDEERPIGFNILKTHSAREKDLVASDLVAVFRRLSTSWGDQMTAVLGNAVLAFLESNRSGTLVDLRRFLLDRKWRCEFLASVPDPQVRLFWEQEFPLLVGRPQVPILTRLDAFLRPRSIRLVVAQKESRLDLGAVMDEGRIFIAKLAQGAIGEENTYLMGSLLVSKFHQATLAREGKQQGERRDFFLYVDEFHNFATPSLSALLAGARKYHVGLLLANQELRQLKESELQSSVLTNPATRVCFRVGDDDARKLAEGFASFEPPDLQNLGRGEALCRIERSDQDFSLRVPAPKSLDPKDADRRRGAARTYSRECYGTPRTDIEAMLAEAIAASIEPPSKRPPVPEDAGRPPRAAPAEGPRRPLPVTEQAAKVPATLTAPVHQGGKGPSVAKEPESVGGRGGPQHKYLQTLIKRYAEEKGYRATVEAALPGGGRVDVLLERDGESIACEISVTSTPEQELENLTKCLTAGIGRVVLVSPEPRSLKRVEKLATDQLDGETLRRVSFRTPEEFFSLLEEIENPASASERKGAVLGYKVKTKFKDSEREQGGRAKVLADTIIQALKRLRRQ
jgi:uncharacterized protein DUF87